jgi:hypothetical protein
MNVMNLPMRQVNLAIFGKGVYHMAIKVFNGLPETHNINSSAPKKFKANLKDFFFVYELLLYNGGIF